MGLAIQIQKSVIELGGSVTILPTPLLSRRLTYQKTQGSLCLPADHTEGVVIREKRKIILTNPLYQQYRDQRCVE
jgi:hypothetical protein